MFARIRRHVNTFDSYCCPLLLLPVVVVVIIIITICIFMATHNPKRDTEKKEIGEEWGEGEMSSIEQRKLPDKRETWGCCCC